MLATPMVVAMVVLKVTMLAVYWVVEMESLLGQNSVEWLVLRWVPFAVVLKAAVLVRRVVVAMVAWMAPMWVY